MINPKIRFKKSDGSDYQDYNTKRLGVLENENKLTLNRGNVIPKGEGCYPVYSSSVKNNGLMCYSDNYMFDKELITWSIDGGGDFFYRPKHKYSVTNVSGYIEITDENYLNYRYLAYQLQDLHSHLHFDYQTKAHPSVIRDLYTVAIPEIEEQTKIANFLSEIDNLIASAEHEVESTKQLKKAMLQKMFPKKGEKFPEIRFPEFTDAWEQRKVTELGKIYIGLVTTMTKHYTNEGTLLIRNSDIKDGRFEFGDTPIYLENTFAQENESRMHQIGDVITVHTGDVGTSAVITENEAKSIGFATIVTRPDTQIIVPNYLCTFLNTDKHKRWAVAISTGDGRTNYNLGDYYELVVPVPSIREQQAISSFVQNLNNLITLHQRKLDAYKKFKKAMMQKMFV